jgi:hypothetical protein
LKNTFFLSLALFFAASTYAQSGAPAKLDPAAKAKKTETVTLPKDSTKKDIYHDLLNDDSLYNIKYPIWKPALEVILINESTTALDRYILKADFAKVSLKTFQYNIKKGWEWDVDKFGVNFIGHPYSGSLTFNAARSCGYSYWQSIPFALEGSLLYEYFGENTRPSYNDLVNTTINGAFLGEALYRVSSNILDDRTFGAERTWREIFAGLVDPIRGVNRLLQGKTFKHTDKEVYQKEPINVTIYSGIHSINAGSGLKVKPVGVFNLQLDYGNAFEVRARKPFDLFRIRTDFNIGGPKGSKVLDIVSGYGTIFSKNGTIGNRTVLYGLFEDFDYWNNRFFELGTTAIGPGLITKHELSKDINFYSTYQLCAVPLAGAGVHYRTDTATVRDYNYGGGLEAKYEGTLTLGKKATIGLLAYYFWTHTYVGEPGNNFLGVLRPRLTIQLYKNLSVGYENFAYFNNQYYTNRPLSNADKTIDESKIFLLFFFEDPKRKGHYN